MSNFKKVIGYETIKSELMQICDMLKNKEVYQELGAKFPKGVLLYGEPGLGKTLMARCSINECNLETFTIRKNKSEKFVGYITETFKKAKEKAPSVIFWTIWTNLQMKTTIIKMPKNMLQFMSRSSYYE